MFRKILFWSHLVCGVTAGLVIFMMSLTGVLLTYERQILAWVEAGHFIPAAEQSTPLPLTRLHRMTGIADGFRPTTLTVVNDPGAPVTLAAGRQGQRHLNPYSGEEMTIEAPALDAFFRTTTGIHRWFNLSGEGRDTARAITGASNLMFLFLVLSGIYLWFPRIWSWAMFRIRLAFRNTAGNGKARDFNWHHVLGIWSAIPLVFIVASASVFYYSWANELVYRVYGEEAPVRGRRGGPPTGDADIQATGSVPAQTPAYLDLDTLFARARTFIEDDGGSWRQMSLSLPDANDRTMSIAIDQGNGGQPQLRHTLVLDRVTGEVADWQPFSSQSPGLRTRSIIRFLHTGEVFGLTGQTIAGLVSLASLVMVWTGLALAWRRLVRPLLRK